MRFWSVLKLLFTNNRWCIVYTKQLLLLIIYLFNVSITNFTNHNLTGGVLVSQFAQNPAETYAGVINAEILGLLVVFLFVV